jgi:hypothetical protein
MNVTQRTGGENVTIEVNNACTGEVWRCRGKQEMCTKHNEVRRRKSTQQTMHGETRGERETRDAEKRSMQRQNEADLFVVQNRCSRNENEKRGKR